MKIAFIIPKLANKGPIIVVKDLIEKIKHKAEIIDVYYFDNVEEITLNCNCYKINFFNAIDFEKYDVVHSHMFRPDLYVYFHKKNKHLNTLFVSTLHQNIYANLKADYNNFIALVFEKIWLFALGKQDTIITLTKVMRDYYGKKTKINLKTIYNGRTLSLNNKQSINDGDFEKLNAIKSKYIIIGSHSTLSKRKGIHQIIQSLTLLENYAAVIIGEGKELLSLMTLSKNLNVDDRCIFLGYKPDAISYLKYFDLYVMSSYSEGFPLGLLEAGLNRLPVVCSDIPIFRELFSEDEVSFFQLENIDSLSNAIKKCHENNSAFSEFLNKKIIKTYSLDVMADNYYKLYNSVKA